MAWRWSNVPAPEFHLGGLSIGIVLHVLVSWSLFPAWWMGHVLGWPLALAGLALALWAVVAAGAVLMDRPKNIVVGGPYAYSRNPMYVGWSLIYAGITLVVNTIWPLVTLPVVLLLTHLQVLREERELKARFGAAYRGYVARTRRYV